ncbi:MAG: right-handed parallel beta-helix repeat-containing protein, partial [Candidatus Eisenbacteria bacterium]|nr:right-handed parallel beta-helix repeat-containing protein [Candidatus Eisenbacteria bacterium]
MRTSTLVVLGLFLATAAPARTIYVASNGDAQGPAPSVETRYDDGSADHPFHELARAAATAETASRNGEPVLIELAGGHHWLTPQEYLDPTCGNCEDAATAVPATLGIRLAGRHVRLTGAPDHTSIVHTRSGYGILVQDCDECAVTGLLVTGGVRDPDGRATDAAIVVQRSSLLVRDNILRDNIGDAGTLAEVVVGVMGVTGREGSRLRLEGNRILRNSWDGVALYRDAEATIVDNVIDGIDLALGRDAGGGRGVGIGLTWNARATVRGNRITRYWKGIGVFVDAQAVVENNVVEGVATWGLSLWDAGRGRPHADFRGNVVDSTGACGASIVRERADGPPPG